MAATPLTPVRVGGSAGLVLEGTGNSEVACDTANGNSFPNRSGKAYLFVRNSTANARTVIITALPDSDGNVVTNKTVNIAASVSTIIGPLDPARYGDFPTCTGSHTDLKFTAVIVA